MMPKWVYPLAFLFVLFLIYNDPTGSGDTAGNFAGFIVELLSAVGEFLTGLFEGTSEADGATTTSSVVDSYTPDAAGEPITHDHDGTVAPHSHPTTSTTTSGG